MQRARGNYRKGSSKQASSSRRYSLLRLSALICWRYYLTREGRSADAQDYPIRCAGLWIGYARQVAFAGEKTVTLAVKNMYCADGPFIVKKSLEGVPGVAKAGVSLKDKTAIVTFDDTKADVSALTNATTKAGYPSTPES